MILFNTYNSEFKPGFIASFKSAVMARGAASFEHMAVQRGRMTRQIGPDEMLRNIDAGWRLVPPQRPSGQRPEGSEAAGG